MESAACSVCLKETVGWILDNNITLNLNLVWAARIRLPGVLK
jgi:hypothetical protein